MYIVIVLKTKESMILKTAKQVSKAVGCHQMTVLRHKQAISWEYKEFTIFNPSIVKLSCKPRGKSL